MHRNLMMRGTTLSADRRSFRSIMVPLADSIVEHVALKTAVRIARASNARLHVVHVRTARSSASASPETASLANAIGWAAHELEQSVSFRLLEPGPQAENGGIAQSLKHYAMEHGIDLIVMVRRRHSVNRLLFGSVSERLILELDVPILFLPQREHTLPACGCRILLPLDGSEAAETILDDATRLARTLKGSISLMSVLIPVTPQAEAPTPALDHWLAEEGVLGLDPAQEYLDRMAGAVQANGVPVHWHTETGESLSPAVLHAALADRIHVVALAPRVRAHSLQLADDSLTRALLKKNETALLVRRQRPD
jgi:nucleotide-binding universal stress UspA family protein